MKTPQKAPNEAKPESTQNFLSLQVKSSATGPAGRERSRSAAAGAVSHDAGNDPFDPIAQAGKGNWRARGRECRARVGTVIEKGRSRSRVVWTIPGLGSALCAVIRLPIITSLSVGPNTRARERRTAARVAGLVVDAAETLAKSVARSERFGLTLEEM